MWSRWTFLAVSLGAIALTSQVRAQGQQGYPPAGYQPYPQGQPMPQQPMPQQPMLQQPMPQQPMPQQPMPPQGYYPQQQPGPEVQGGYGYPQQGYAPNAGYPGYAAAPPPQLVSSVAGAIQIGAGISLLSFGSTALSPSTPSAPPAMMGMVPAAVPFITSCCAVK